MRVVAFRSQSNMRENPPVEGRNSKTTHIVLVIGMREVKWVVPEGRNNPKVAAVFIDSLAIGTAAWAYSGVDIYALASVHCLLACAASVRGMLLPSVLLHLYCLHLCWLYVCFTSGAASICAFYPVVLPSIHAVSIPAAAISSSFTTHPRSFGMPIRSRGLFSPGLHQDMTRKKFKMASMRQTRPASSCYPFDFLHSPDATRLQCSVILSVVSRECPARISGAFDLSTEGSSDLWEKCVVGARVMTS